MDLPLYGTVLVSAAAAAVVVVVVTRAIEKLGGVLGGVIATTPTTILVASLGLLSVADTHDDFTVALYNVPIGQLIDGIFLISWRVLPPRLDGDRTLRRKLAIMISASLLVWLVLSGVQFVIGHFLVDGDVWRARAMGLSGLAVSWIVGTLLCWRHVDAPRGTNHVTVRMMLARALATGCSIALCVYVGSLSAIAGGILSTFPIIFLTSMVSLWVSQGEAVGVGAVAPMVLGSTSVPSFAMLFAEGVRITRTGYAFLVAYVLAVLLVSVPVFFYIRWRQEKAALHGHLPLPTPDIVLEDVPGASGPADTIHGAGVAITRLEACEDDSDPPQPGTQPLLVPPAAAAADDHLLVPDGEHGAHGDPHDDSGSAILML